MTSSQPPVDDPDSSAPDSHEPTPQNQGEAAPEPTPQTAPEPAAPDPAWVPGSEQAQERADEQAEPATSELAGKPVQIPVQIPELLTWTVEDYAGSAAAALVFGHSAAKLADSAVAPIVAAARGYRSYDRDNSSSMWGDFPLLPKGNSTQARFLREAVNSSDVLIMPWFNLKDVTESQSKALPLSPTTLQYRPAKPRQNAKGKDVKYEFVSGHDTCVGMHPAIEATWLESAPVVLVAEGLLKGDAALSAYLHSVVGMSREELAYCGPDAREIINRRLKSVDRDQQIVILAIAGVGNWRRNPEWRTVNFRNHDVWLGIDGDVETNRHVYSQAQDFRELVDSHHGRMFLLAPKAVGGDGGEIKKMGIDDYLSKVGTWTDLVAQLRPELPPAPSDNSADLVGTYRINAEGTALEVCKPITDEFDRVIAGLWEQVYPLGGRIVACGGTRSPLEREIAEGKPDPEATFDEDSEDCIIEVSWADPLTNAVKTYRIEAPSRVLGYAPDQWDRYKARIPGEVLRHHDWPVPREHAEAWLRAMKAHRADEITTSTRWDVMGWVPTPSGIPAFIIGEQVIAAHEEDIDQVVPGVTDHVLAGASKFGVGDLHGDFEDEHYRQQVRADIELLLGVYILNGAWRRREKAASILATALRPCLPIRPKPTALFVGPRRKGKGFSAGAIMGFWSRFPGDWSSDSLPGSAKDSITAMELAVSRSVIWVADDLAPSTSKRQAEQEQDNIGTLIRNVFNGQGKARSNVQLGARKKYLPRAQFIVTAENDPTVSSVRDRCMVVELGHGELAATLDPTNAVEHLYRVDGAPARVAQALIRFIQFHAIDHCNGSWPSLYAEVQRDIGMEERDAKANLHELGRTGSDIKRQASIAADQMVALHWLAAMADEVGAAEAVDLIRGRRGLKYDICRLVAEADVSSNETSPGFALISALNKCLARGVAHVIDPHTPGIPPLDVDGRALHAARLGWRLDSEKRATANGDRIGQVVRDGDQYLVMFDPVTAFDVAKRYYPSLIPEGSSHSQSWQAAAGEGFLHHKRLKSNSGNGALLTTARRQIEGQEVRGCPVPLDCLYEVASVAQLQARQSRDEQAMSESEAIGA